MSWLDCGAWVACCFLMLVSRMLQSLCVQKSSNYRCKTLPFMNFYFPVNWRKKIRFFPSQFLFPTYFTLHRFIGTFSVCTINSFLLLSCGAWRCSHYHADFILVLTTGRMKCCFFIALSWAHLKCCLLILWFEMNNKSVLKLQALISFFFFCMLWTDVETDQSRCTMCSECATRFLYATPSPNTALRRVYVCWGNV